MRYFKITENHYITAVGMGFCGEAITKEEYDELFSLISNVPQPKPNNEYRLKDDFSWEEHDTSNEPELDAEEMLGLLIGGAA